MSVAKQPFGRMMKSRLLTVVTVSRNDPKGLKFTANSLMTQKDNNFRWLVIDGSDASTRGLMRSVFDNINLPDSQFIEREAKGIYDAMNVGANNTDTDWVMFLNCGDAFYSSETISNFINEVRIHPSSNLIAFSVAIQTTTGFIIDIVQPRVVKYREFLYANMNHQGVFIRTSWLISLGGFDTNLKLAADSLLLDKSISLSSPIVSNRVGSIFVLGGHSGKYFRLTLREIATYRRNVPRGIRREILVLKTKLRLKILNYDTNGGLWKIIEVYLRKRNHHMLKLVNSIQN